jgi:hypothetical protein
MYVIDASDRKRLEETGTGARPTIQNPENKKLLTLLGSFSLTSTRILGKGRQCFLLSVFRFLLSNGHDNITDAVIVVCPLGQPCRETKLKGGACFGSFSALTAKGAERNALEVRAHTRIQKKVKAFERNNQLYGFNVAGEELSQLLEEDKMAGVPLLVLANKQDLINALPANEVCPRIHITEQAIFSKHNSISEC